MATAQDIINSPQLQEQYIKWMGPNQAGLIRGQYGAGNLADAIDAQMRSVNSVVDKFTEALGNQSPSRYNDNIGIFQKQIMPILPDDLKQQFSKYASYGPMTKQSDGSWQVQNVTPDIAAMQKDAAIPMAQRVGAQVSAASAGQSGNLQFKSPTGTIFEAPAGSDAAKNFLANGYSQVAGGTSSSSKITLPDGSVIDTTGLSPATVASLTTLNKYLGDQTASGQKINPDLNITPEMTQKYVDAAHAAYSPYYNQLYSQGQADITKGITRNAEDYQTSVNKIGTTYGKNLEATQENFARRGLNMSTDRNRAENTLATGANTELNAATQLAMRNSSDLGTKGERTLGSTNMPTNLASINTGFAAGLGQPGQYGLTSSNQSRQLYNPVGNTIGDYQRNQSSDERNWAADAVAGKRQLYGQTAYQNQYNNFA